MRFKEFKTILEKRLIDQEGSTGYYTVGDSHAVGLANYTGKPWINKGKNGMPSTEPMHFQAIDSIPSFILEDIYKIVSDLYYVYNIEYIDVTPYNFVEVEGHVWIIDFGHAMKRQAGRKTNWYLRDIFDEGKISYWNSDFK
jgi:hypothetical protein